MQYFCFTLSVQWFVVLCGFGNGVFSCGVLRLYGVFFRSFLVTPIHIGPCFVSQIGIGWYSVCRLGWGFAFLFGLGLGRFVGCLGRDIRGIFFRRQRFFVVLFFRLFFLYVGELRHLLVFPIWFFFPTSNALFMSRFLLFFVRNANFFFHFPASAFYVFFYHKDGLVYLRDYLFGYFPTRNFRVGLRNFYLGPL